MTSRFEDLYINGTCYTSNWFRSYGSTGWYNESYGGGIYMVDPTWVRTYGSKRFYCNSEIRGNTITCEAYIQPSAGSGNNGIIFPSNPGGGDHDVAYIKYWPFSGEACILKIAIENDANDYMILSTPQTHVQLGTGGVITLQGSATTTTSIPASDGSIKTDWPGGWRGGLATWDIVCSGIKTANGIVTSSDIRIKNNINPVSFGLDFIKKLEPVTYYWNKDHNPYEYTRKQYGFIAQEIEKLEPCLVLDGSYDEQTGQDGVKSLNYTGFIPILTKAIQEQQQQIESQQKTIESLETRLKALEDLLK